jgi:hypothetical protein
MSWITASWKASRDSLNTKTLKSFCEAAQSALDETAYLLSSPANRERLLNAIARVERGENLVTIDMDELQ